MRDSGLPLALGVLGGLALAGSVHGALYDHAGSPARRVGVGGRFRRVPVPTGFTTSPLPFVRGYVLQEVVDSDERGRAEPGTGLFHVTTNLPAVLADRDATHPLGRLRSRRELRAMDRHGAGLGGGGRDVMPDRVSVALRLSAAQRILRGMRLMARAVHGQIEPDAAMEEMLDLTEGVRHVLETTADWVLDDESRRHRPEAGPDELEQELKSDEISVRRAFARAKSLGMNPGHVLYESLAGYEETLVNAIGEWTSNGWISDDEMTCQAPVGFTEPAERFARVQPENLGLLQLAGRKGASVEFVNNECELRFRPEDLRVVGTWEER